MAKIIKAGWQDWDGGATEYLTLQETQEGFYAKSVITHKTEDSFTARYTIACDGGWRAKECIIELIERKSKIVLESDGLGRWLCNSKRLARLSGAIDIDISVTPFTNTLPIRRLKLAEEQSAEIAAAYISVPDFEVFLDKQRYTCLIGDKRYRYESLDSDFVRDIEVDRHGLVLQYPGLFKRIY